MESASPEHQSENPPGHLANFIGIVIAALTLTLPLCVILNFTATEVSVPHQPASVSMKSAK
jgi:ABC-type phosphate/phosphonate transport system permease subunit